MTLKQIKNDFNYCEKIMKKASKSFYYAFSTLPKEKARSVYAIYAFCRIIDDAIDDETDSKVQMQKLDSIKYDLVNLDQVDHPIHRALSVVLNRYQASKEPYFDQLKGQESDIFFNQPKDLDGLVTYSDLVAGSVGRMLLPILASETDNSADLRKSATNLGIGMQITNILRDIGEDYRDRKRIYIPKSYMQKYNYSEEDLANNTINDNFKQLWEDLAGEAEKRYQYFFNYLDQYDKNCRQQIRKSALVYREILQVVRENNYNCLTKRQYVPLGRMRKIGGA